MITIPTSPIQPWQHDLDAKQYLTQVHMKFKDYLGPDFKLAKFDEKEREFIMTLVTSGIMAVDLCPNPDIGIQIKDMDFAYINTLAILKFNVDGNMVVDRITSWQQEKPDDEHGSEFIENLTKRIKGDLKPRSIPE